MTFIEELFSLDGLVALVTGGSSGLGREMALALGRAGAAVVVMARRERQLAETVAELESFGCRAASVVVDLADRAALERAAGRSIEPFGAPDVLVNAAGINLRPPLAELEVADWDRTLAVNLDAPFLLGQHFAPKMADRGFGRIVNVGSQQSIRAFGNSGAYGVSKAGVLGLTRSQAEAWSRSGVCCNAIVPGLVRTEMTAALLDDSEQAAQHAVRTLVGRNGEPADFRGAIVFLASRASQFVTGQALFVDGGYSVH